jgi:ubiquinone/menaquinone biosynthesis C-methylase UbiE
VSSASITVKRLITHPATRELSTFELIQQQHYDEIASDYEAHYSDTFSSEYRKKFIYGPMFEGLSLSGKNVLDAMCGTGQTTEHLLKANAVVTGLDISSEVMNTFQQRWPKCQSVSRSLLDTQLRSESFDCISVVGGLHHVQPNVTQAIEEIHRLLKPGGYFCFMEPHTGSLPNLVRQLWYKHDRFFSDNEEAIDVQKLEEKFASHFRFNRASYLGNIAFLLVLNSLIFRIPVSTKKFYSPLLLRLEAVLTKLQTKSTSCFVVAQWQKRS